MEENFYKILDHSWREEVKKINSLIGDRKTKDSFGTVYMKRIDAMFKHEMSKIDRWGFYPGNGNIGILTPKNKLWDDLNRMNTHPELCKFFVGELLNSNPNAFNNFGSDNTNRENIEKLVQFIYKNYELYFTKNITDVYFNHIYWLLQRSWRSGNITMILAICHIRKIFPDIVSISYELKTGDPRDMINGIDLSVTLTDGQEIKFQVKSGTTNGVNYNGNYYINGSPNKMKYYECDYFIYGSVPFGKRLASSIVVFKNGNYNKKEGSLIVPVENIYYKYEGSMPIPEMLNEMTILLSKNNLSLTIQKDESTNYFELVEYVDEYDKMTKELVFNFGDPLDENLENLIKEKLDELKNLFN